MDPPSTATALEPLLDSDGDTDCGLGAGWGIPRGASDVKDQSKAGWSGIGTAADPALDVATATRAAVAAGRASGGRSVAPNKSGTAESGGVCCNVTRGVPPLELPEALTTAPKEPTAWMSDGILGEGVAVNGGVAGENDWSLTPATALSKTTPPAVTLGAGSGKPEPVDMFMGNADVVTGNGKGCAVNGGVAGENDCSRTPAT
jgi:hypothetical protein